MGAQPFQLLKFPMPKRDWTPEDIELVHSLLKGRVKLSVIAGQFKDTKMSDIAEIARLLGERPYYGNAFGGMK